MQKTKEQLEIELAEKIHEREQLEHQYNRYKNMESYFKEKERKARTHRLIQRGGAVESILPEVRDMDEKAFYEVLELFFRNDEIRKKFNGCIFAVKSGKL